MALILVCMQAVEEANEIKNFPDCLVEMGASIGSHFEVVKGITIQTKNLIFYAGISKRSNFPKYS